MAGRLYHVSDRIWNARITGRLRGSGGFLTSEYGPLVLSFDIVGNGLGTGGLALAERLGRVRIPHVLDGHPLLE
ncbi:hypothetical protein C485_05643 [Natrinema altunense JCM 12890]|uniref:Uncharacterized protein n=1 Tax=Natrinema altunense (strain JCM 12890 / CGMCC 1.3731 / AJ2) TaxID=1227494 RepID=L9ZQ49_NATA2|nr:hypothetical protein C485_05643 [Natrinema altunense JCM 12890]